MESVVGRSMVEMDSAKAFWLGQSNDPCHSDPTLVRWNTRDSGSSARRVVPCQVPPKSCAATGWVGTRACRKRQIGSGRKKRLKRFICIGYVGCGGKVRYNLGKHSMFWPLRVGFSHWSAEVRAKSLGGSFC